MKTFLIAFNALLSVNLAFVSICSAKTSASLQKASTNDEFFEFEAELDAAEGKKVLKTNDHKKTPAPTAPPAAKPLTKEELLEKGSRLKAEIRAQPHSYAKIIELADTLAQQGETKSATALLWKHVDKIDRSGLLTLAKIHIAAKEYGDGHRALNLMISKNEKDFEAHSLKGDIFSQERKKKEALESYQSALDAKNNYEPAYTGLINLYENMTPPNLYELRILYQDMVKNIGKKSVYLQKICEINFLDSVYESATTTCKEAIQQDGSIPDAHVYLGASLNFLGENKKAEDTLKKSALKFPKSELALFYYGSYLEEQKNFVEAYNVYKNATKVDEKAARSWLGYGKTAFELKKFEESLAAYKKACRLDKKTAPIFRKATSILRINRNAEWTSQFEDASENCSL